MTTRFGDGFNYFFPDIGSKLFKFIQVKLPNILWGIN